MRQVYEQVAQVARTNTTVLIRGESGTGKELIAHAHPLQLAARQEAVHQGELRGAAAGPDRVGAVRLREGRVHRRATARKKGRFELAEGGTLFLDEIGDINLATQVKLLRVLQEREFERLGGTETIRANVRLIAATNKDLEKAIAAGDVPRGPLLPPQRLHDLRAAAARAEARHAAAGRPLPREVLARARQGDQADLDAGHRHADAAITGRATCASWRTCIERAVLVCDGAGHPRAPPAADAADGRSVRHRSDRARCATRSSAFEKERCSGRAEDRARQPREGGAAARHDRAHLQLQGPEVRHRLAAIQKLMLEFNDLTI